MIYCGTLFHLQCERLMRAGHGGRPFNRDSFHNQNTNGSNDGFTGIKTVETEQMVAENSIFLVRFGKFTKLTEFADGTEIGETSSSR